MSEPRKFRGLVGADGNLRLDDASAWAVTLTGHRDKRVQVTLEAERKTRSTPQLRRYFGCVVPVVMGVLNAKRDPQLLPLSKEQIHYLILGAFVGFEETPLGLVPIRSRTLTPAQFAELSDRVEAHYRAEGITFPKLDQEMEVA